VLHPGAAGVSKAEMREKLAKLYKVRGRAASSDGHRRRASAHAASPGCSRPARYRVAGTRLCDALSRCAQVQDATTIVLFGFKLAFGGGRSTGFGMIYDSTTVQKKFEPRHRLIKVNLAKAKVGARKQRKELKNRLKKLRGLKKAKAKAGSGN